jgi:hypothetical protein
MILVAGPLSALLGSIKQSQLIVHVMLINVAYPVTATIFFGMLMSVLTFQFYDFTTIYNRAFYLDPDADGSKPLNEQFGLMGYSSHYLIINFGTLFLTIFWAPLKWIASTVIVRLSNNIYCANRKKKYHRSMYFDYWVSFFNDTYLFLAVCVLINLNYFKWPSYGDAVNCLLALSFGSVIVLFPFFVLIFYNLGKNYNKILKLDKEFKERFGSILEGLNFKRQGRSVLIYTFATLVRKLWLAIIVVCFKDNQVFNIIQVNCQALLMMVVIS